MTPHHLAIKIKAQQNFLSKLDLPWEDFITQVGLTDKGLVRKRILLEQEGRCASCGIHEWRGQQISFELEHKDGSHHNDARDNLEVLCPNCHSLTSTWKGRHKESHKKKVSDAELMEALRTQPSIRQALISVGMAGKGSNYHRAKFLKNRMGS